MQSRQLAVEALETRTLLAADAGVVLPPEPLTGDADQLAICDQADVASVLNMGENGVETKTNGRGVTKTFVSGSLSEEVTLLEPGTMWQEGNVLHIRGQKFSGPQLGDLEGTQEYVVNLDLNLKTGRGHVHNVVTLYVKWGGEAGEGREGVFQGRFTAQVRNNVIANNNIVYHGIEGDFIGLKMVHVNLTGTVGDPVPNEYEGVIIEPN